MMGIIDFLNKYRAFSILIAILSGGSLIGIYSYFFANGFSGGIVIFIVAFLFGAVAYAVFRPEVRSKI